MSTNESDHVARLLSFLFFSRCGRSSKGNMFMHNSSSRTLSVRQSSLWRYYLSKQGKWRSFQWNMAFVHYHVMLKGRKNVIPVFCLSIYLNYGGERKRHIIVYRMLILWEDFFLFALFVISLKTIFFACFSSILFFIICFPHTGVDKLVWDFNIIEPLQSYIFFFYTRDAVSDSDIVPFVSA